MTATTELAETISEIFNHMGWIWGLELAGIPEHIPDANAIAAKINELCDKNTRAVRLASNGRVVVIADHDYPDLIRVLLDIGELHKTEGT